jgi:acyl-CoA carboxylase subunit beta
MTASVETKTGTPTGDPAIPAQGRPNLAAAAVTADTPKWAKCAKCGALNYLPRLERGNGVCPDCGHHGRLSAQQRLDLLLDDGSFEPAEVSFKAVDVLGFTDKVPYPDRLDAARRKTGLDDAVRCGRGTVDGRPIVVVVMDFGFMGGSMGAAVGETVTAAADLALAGRTPLLVVTASGGARMQEGAVSLMQMAKTSEAFVRLRQAGVPSICLLTDPTYGGVTASFATLGDVLIAESGSAIGFAGPNVIQKATGKGLPDGFQRAEHLLAHGMLDRVEPRSGVRRLISRLLGLFAGVDAAGGGSDDAPSPVVTNAAELPEVPAAQVVRTARDSQRPTTVDYSVRICEDFVELHGDRLFGDDPSVVGGLASIDGRTVMLVGHQKGHDTRELVARNFGMPQPEGYRKSLRLMRLADRLGIPVVTLVDTQGAYPGVGAEERGQAWAIAEAIAAMAELTVPVVAAVIGEGGSGGALALAVANRVLITSNAFYSVISPESCSTILFGDPGHTDHVAGALNLTAPALLRLGVVDGVLPEPEGGTQADPAAAATALRAAVVTALAELAELPREELARQRAQRFRRIGRLANAAG